MAISCDIANNEANQWQRDERIVSFRSFVRSHRKMQIMIILFTYLCHPFAVGLLSIAKWYKNSIRSLWIMKITNFFFHFPFNENDVVVSNAEYVKGWQRRKKISAWLIESENVDLRSCQFRIEPIDLEWLCAEHSQWTGKWRYRLSYANKHNVQSAMFRCILFRCRIMGFLFPQRGNSNVIFSSSSSSSRWHFLCWCENFVHVSRCHWSTGVFTISLLLC